MTGPVGYVSLEDHRDGTIKKIKIWRYYLDFNIPERIVIAVKIDFIAPAFLQ